MSLFKAHLPGGLGHDPRLWQRDDVAVFMRYCEREFDLDKIDMDKFQMNGELRDFIEIDISVQKTLRNGFWDLATYSIIFLIKPGPTNTVSFLYSGDQKCKP